MIKQFTCCDFCEMPLIARDERADQSESIGGLIACQTCVVDRPETIDDYLEEWIGRRFKSVGLSADWVNSCYQLRDNLVLFENDNGQWSFISHYTPVLSSRDEDPERESTIHHDCELRECYEIILELEDNNYSPKRLSDVSKDIAIGALVASIAALN